MSEDKKQPTAPSQPAKENIVGVFSRKVISTIGTGATKRKKVQTSFFYIEEQADGSIEVQPISSNYVPSGPTETITKEELLERYDPEPEIYTEKVFPQIRDLEKTIARAERFRKQHNSFSAEFEYEKALKVDEQNVRATFGIGLCYLDRGAREKAEDILQRLAKLPAAFEERHKHLFNEFGINLRKQDMFKEALDYYTRALEYTENDENLYYNLARAAYQLEDFAATAEYLKKCLSINPEMEYARKLAMHMKKKGQLPSSK